MKPLPFFYLPYCPTILSEWLKVGQLPSNNLGAGHPFEGYCGVGAHHRRGTGCIHLYFLEEYMQLDWEGLQ